MLKRKSRGEASVLGVSYAILATIIARGFGFIREVLMADVFGTTADGDSIIIALNIPTVMVSGVASALATIYIPAYYKIKNKKDNENDNDNTLSRINTTLLVLLLMFGIFIVTVVEFFPEIVVKIFAPGFSNEDMLKCSSQLRITIIATIPILVAGLYKAYGQIKNKYAWLIFFGCVINILLILVLVFVKKNVAIMLCVASFVGYFLYLFIVMCLTSSEPMQFAGKVDLKNQYIKEMVRCFFPVLISHLITEINQIVDKNFASHLVSGTISALNYSSKIVNLITAVLGTAISSVLFVRLSQLAAADDKDKIATEIVKINSYLLTMVLPIFWTVAVFSKLITVVIYGRGNFDFNSVMITSECLAFYSLGIIAFNLKALWVRCYNASLNTKIPAVNSSIAVIINIVLNFILVSKFQHKGLVIATVVASIITDFLLVINYKKVNPAFKIKTYFYEFMKVTVASFAYLLIYWGVNYCLSQSLVLACVQVLVSFIVASIVYILILILVKAETGLFIYREIEKRLIVKS